MQKIINLKVYRSREGWEITVHGCHEILGDYVSINTPFGLFRFVGAKEEALRSVRKLWRNEVLSVPRFCGGLVYEVGTN